MGLLITQMTCTSAIALHFSRAMAEMQPTSSQQAPTRGLAPGAVGQGGPSVFLHVTVTVGRIEGPCTQAGPCCVART